MKLSSFKSIRTRLTYWFLLLSLIPLLIILVITYFQQVNVIETRTFDKLTAIRDLKVEQLENWLTERTGDLLTASTDNELIILEEIIFKEHKDQSNLIEYKNIRRILNRYLSNYDAYSEIFIINPRTGIVEISTNQNYEGMDKSDYTYFTEPLQTGGLFIKDVYYSKTLLRNAMTFSIPIFCSAHEPPHIIGIMVARVDLKNSLYALLMDRVGLGETGETLIVSKDIVALNELRWYDNAPLNLQISDEPAVNAAYGETGIMVTSDYRGKDILAAYTYIPQTGWGFICKQDMYELNAPIREMIMYVIIVFIFTAIVISIIAFGISKSISKPIVEMDSVAQKIRAGDFSVRNTITSKDELGSLALAFNNMAETTESRIKIQQGISNISETMIGQSSMQEFGSELLKQLMEITGANMSTFYILNEATSEYEHFASVGANEKLLKPFNAENPEGEFGNAFSKKSIYYLQEIPEDTIFKYKTTAGDAIPKEIITIPVLVESTVVALISLVNIQKFSKECYDILKLSWLSINSSYSSLLGGERTRILAEQLSKTNRQLEAQTEELQDQAEELQDQAEELQLTSEELQEQNLELEAQRIQVEEANRLKSEFLSNMSHELRTPLNSIMALSRVLITQTKNKLSDEENNYLEIVERNGKRLLSLVNDILDLSKIEAGKVEILPEFISIGALLQLIKENMQSFIEEKGLTFTLSVPDNLPKVETDESRLHQVLTNIIGNAVKFTEKGSVDIAVKHDSQNVLIEVNDTGVGISKEVLPHIFDEFRQADGTSSRQYEGTGLGLAIANKMTNILGGNIKVKSKLGKGSVFIITIPIKWHEEILLAQDVNLKTTTQSEKSTILVVDDEQKTVKDISNTCILIVEDNQDAIIQVKAVLENEGYKIDVAGSGQEALDYVQHTIPDGIILDLMMPDIDGFEVLEKIRNIEKTKKIPVLVLTAKDLSKEELKKLSSNNIQQIVQKGDVDIEGLLYKVKLLLGNEPKSKTKDKRKKLERNGSPLQADEDVTNADLPNVLIVEDNPDNMMTIKAILKGKYNIAEAVDGAQGLRMALFQIPDIILLDMALPKMAGEEIVRILKINNETKNIPIVAVTARTMKGDKEKLLEVGCDGYIPKPIDPETLLAEIGNLLSG